MMKSVIEYLECSQRGVIANPLGAITPEKAIVKLHNIVHELFYQENSALELRIDFDPKKIDT